MTPTALTGLNPARRRLILESQRLARKLDAVFGPEAREKVASVTAATGLVHRRGKIRILTVEDQREGGIAGRRVAAARTKLGWTQQDLADRSGIARANIARLESGRHSPHMDTLKRVASALGTTPANFLREPSFTSAAEDREWLESGLDDWSKALDAEDPG